MAVARTRNKTAWHCVGVVLGNVLLVVSGCQAPGHTAKAWIDTGYADLRAELEACRKAHLADASKKQVDELRSELDQHNALIEALQQRDAALRRILDIYSQGVCLLHGTFGFVDPGNSTDELVTDEAGTPIQLSYIGSGFLVSENGDVVTNRHVAEPWWNNPSVSPLLARGWSPKLLNLTAYFPKRAGSRVELSQVRVSSAADVALLKVDVESTPVLPLSPKQASEYRGQHIILMGYPTGLNALLARAEPHIVSEVLEEATEASEVLQGLAHRGAISPIITQGALNEIAGGKLVYDAETASGGSGGPVIALDGSVIGVNFAVTRDFHGSNLGAPIRHARDLLDIED